MSAGGTYAAGTGIDQMCSGGIFTGDGEGLERSRNNNLSGTWRLMGASSPGQRGNYFVGAVRVS
jgi:hypothetical protein